MGACCPTCGAPAPNPIQGPRNSVVLKPGPRTNTLLVTDRNYVPQLTAYRECDAHTALARGLADYLGQQSVEIGGRRLQLTTYSQWAEPEDNARYPALAVGGGQGTYVRGFTPDGFETLEGDLRLYAITEFTQRLVLEMWANDPRERSYLVAMVEEALSPVTWMYGLRLALPYYHGSTATYELVNSAYLDSTDDSMARFRKAQFEVEASITVYRLVKLPSLRETRVRLDVSDPAVIPTEES